MNDRFQVVTASGDPVIRTDSRADADHFATALGGRVIDTQETTR